MADPTVFVSSPERKERQGGIKSVVGDFATAPRLGAARSLEWLADNCEFPKATPQLCFVPNPIAGSKTFNGITTGTGPIFGLYSGVQCNLGNDQGADYESRARAILAAGEGRGVEEVLWEYGNTAGGTGPAQTSWVAAIGQADEAADTLYVGRPVIMMSRFAAVQARAAKALFGDEETGRLWTANGTPVIASAAATDTMLIVFGWITVYASEITAARAMKHTTNQEMAIAERMYGIAVDCNFALHYAVTVAASDPNQAPAPERLALTIGTDPASPIPDGTDVTVTVHANVSPTDEVHLWYRINGGTWTDHGETVETDPFTFVQNLDGALANPGDVFDLYAQSGAVVSPTITINVT